MVTGIQGGNMMRKGLTLGMALLLFLTASQPSWAWIRGRGWGLFGLGLFTGAAVASTWGPYGYYSDYGYGPYYPYGYPYYDYPPYAYPRVPAASTYATPGVYSTGSDNSPRPLKTVKDHLTRMHDLLAFKYEDGDISKEERDGGFRYLDQIANMAKKEYDANDKSLTARQEEDLLLQIQNADPVNHRSGSPYPEVTATAPTAPESSTTENQIPAETISHHDPQAINDLLLELRTLLNVKLKSGDITKSQHDTEAAYLSRLEQEAHSGTLSSGAAGDVVQKLHQAYYNINHNFVSE
jgi:hypothetical protein